MPVTPVMKIKVVAPPDGNIFTVGAKRFHCAEVLCCSGGVRGRRSSMGRPVSKSPSEDPTCSIAMTKSWFFQKFLRPSARRAIRPQLLHQQRHLHKRVRDHWVFYVHFFMPTGFMCKFSVRERLFADSVVDNKVFVFLEFAASECQTGYTTTGLILAAPPSQALA